ncbi:MAG: hypothetical protein KAU02_04345 [Tenericutes bacterium]|nr:hypothetical protein [Mycoplasmatota bacterium]
MILEQYLHAQVYDGLIKQEKTPPQDYPVFSGALYYKAVSSKDSWLGIEAEITLPKWEPDTARFECFRNAYGEFKRYLDTPSVYVGGSSDHETDIGFGFFQGMLNNKITEGKITFRPFWRTIYIKNGEERNDYLGTDINQTEYYFFPGDKVLLDLVCNKPNFLTLRIELLNETDLYPYKEYRKSLKKPKVLIIENIIAPGNGLKDSEYKRVNAIDQYHNEGKSTQETNAEAIAGSWKNVYLFRKINDKIYKVPFIAERITRIMSPSPNAFNYFTQGNYEVIDINKKR